MDINTLEINDLAFNSAIQWRRYAESLENSLIAGGRQDVPRIASVNERTWPPTAEELGDIA